jgi:hypothetical protein
MAGIDTLVKANTSVPLYPVIPFGTVIIVPIVDLTNENLLKTNLPPWK